MPNITTFKCTECSNDKHEHITTDDTITIKGKSFTITNIPTLKCTSCGALSYTHDAMMYIEAQKKMFKAKSELA